MGKQDNGARTSEAIGQIVGRVIVTLCIITLTNIFMLGLRGGFRDKKPDIIQDPKFSAPLVNVDFFADGQVFIEGKLTNQREIGKFIESLDSAPKRFAIYSEGNEVSEQVQQFMQTGYPFQFSQTPHTDRSMPALPAPHDYLDF